MASKNHYHIYERVGSVKQQNPRYRCIDPDCTHFQTKDLIMGNRAMCECGTTFLLTWDVIRLKRPRCAKCSTGKRNIKWKEEQAQRNVIKDIMKGVI